MGDKTAKGFTKFCIEEKHNRPERFIFRGVLHADNPKPLNYHLMDNDFVTMLKRVYGREEGPTKEELMEYENFLATFFGDEEKGKEIFAGFGQLHLGYVGLKDISWIKTKKERNNVGDCLGVWYPFCNDQGNHCVKR